MLLLQQTLAGKRKIRISKTDTKKGDEPGTHLLTYYDCNKQLQFINVQS